MKDADLLALCPEVGSRHLFSSYKVVFVDKGFGPYALHLQVYRWHGEASIQYSVTWDSFLHVRSTRMYLDILWAQLDLTLDERYEE